jgi:hypothetical protein
MKTEMSCIFHRFVRMTDFFLANDNFFLTNTNEKKVTCQKSNFIFLLKSMSVTFKYYRLQALNDQTSDLHPLYERARTG